MDQAPGVKMDPQHEAAFAGAAKIGRPKITDEQIEHWFAYHPSQHRQADFDAINAASIALCKVIRDRAPACADVSDAIRKVREARMAANAAIACDGR